MANYQPENRQSMSMSQSQTRSSAYHVVRAATAVTAGGSLLLLSGLLVVGTVIALIIATPLLVIFSPVLVPAVIVTALIMGGFVTSGGFGVTAIALLKWMYDYAAGNHPMGSDKVDNARHSIASKAKDIKEFGQQQLSGAGHTS